MSKKQTRFLVGRTGYVDLFLLWVKWKNIVRKDFVINSFPRPSQDLHPAGAIDALSNCALSSGRYWAASFKPHDVFSIYDLVFWSHREVCKMAGLLIVRNSVGWEFMSLSLSWFEKKASYNNIASGLTSQIWSEYLVTWGAMGMPIWSPQRPLDQRLGAQYSQKFSTCFTQLWEHWLPNTTSTIIGKKETWTNGLAETPQHVWSQQTFSIEFDFQGHTWWGWNALCRSECGWGPSKIPRNAKWPVDTQIDMATKECWILSVVCLQRCSVVRPLS